MKIKLLRDWQQLKAGHVFEPQPNVAGELIRRGTAEEVPDITVAEDVPVKETMSMEPDGERAMQEPPVKRGRGRPTNAERAARAKAEAASGVVT